MVRNDNEGILEKGILFNEETKILIAEKFINVQFLIPFPDHNVVISNDVRNLIKSLKNLWEHPSVFCNLSFSTEFEKNDSTFNVDWLLRHVEREIDSADFEVENIRNETATILNEEKQKKLRERRSVTALAALASIGLFGSGLALGKSFDCGLKGVFGTCHDKAKENAENILRTNEFVNKLSDNLHMLENDQNDKFFLVSEELTKMKQIQKETRETQNDNWNLIQEQFDIFESNIHQLRDCNQLLFSRQQINFNYDTISSLLSVLYANIKAYKAALYSYKLNIMNSIPILLKKQLPMSLLSLESLNEIINLIGTEQYKSKDRLSLAIPPDQILAYYEAQLLNDVISIDEGLLTTLSIPLATRTTALNVYKAHAIPMPQDDSDVAILWKIEAEYLAISEDKTETALLSQEQMNKCIGSSNYQICYEGIATETRSSSCLATLFSDSAIDAIKVCDTVTTRLPLTEKAKNLGYGVWLITSATDDYKLTEDDITPGSATNEIAHPGCRICIVTLKCGKKISGPNIRIRADLSTCDDIPAIRTTVALPNPLESLLSEIPNVDELPYFDSKAAAGVELMHTLKEKLKYHPPISDVDSLRKIAKPIALEMTQLKIPMKRELDSYLTLKLSLKLSIMGFIGTNIIHFTVLYIFHRFHFLKKFVPKFLLVNKQQIPIKTIVAVPSDKIEQIQRAKHKWQKHAIIVSENHITNPNKSNPEYKSTTVDLSDEQLNI